MTIGDRVQVKDAPDIIGIISRMNSTHVQLQYNSLTIWTGPITKVRLRNDLICKADGYYSIQDVTRLIPHRTYIC